MGDRSGAVSKLVGSLKRRVDLLDESREKVLVQRRVLLRECRRAISLVHSSRLDEAEGVLNTVLAKLKEMSSETVGDVDALCIMLNAISIVRQEVVEGMVLLSILRGRGLPTPDMLGVSARDYLLGLADAVGELRRRILAAIAAKDLKSARTLLEWMEAIYEPLSQLTYPSSLIPIRHKVDVIRSLLDRTISEYLFHERSVSVLEAGGAGRHG